MEMDNLVIISFTRCLFVSKLNETREIFPFTKWKNRNENGGDAIYICFEFITALNCEGMIDARTQEGKVRSRDFGGFGQLHESASSVLLKLSRRKSFVTYRSYLIFTIIYNFLFFAGCSGNPDAKRLYDDLLSNYNKLVRPVVNVTDALTVKIKLKLSQLIDVVR